MGSMHAIARCRSGDRSAYTEVVAAHADRLVAVLFRILGNLEDARDVAQETFARAFLNLDRYDERRPFEPWLYRIGRNLAYNHIEAKGRRIEGRVERASESRLGEVESPDSPPGDPIEAKEDRRQIEQVLAELRPEYREVLTLRYMEKLEYGEIAARMGVPIGTVRTWLNRAKSQFREAASGKEWF